MGWSIVQKSGRLSFVLSDSSDVGPAVRTAWAPNMTWQAAALSNRNSSLLGGAQLVIICLIQQVSATPPVSSGKRPQLPRRVTALWSLADGPLGGLPCPQPLFRPHASRSIRANTLSPVCCTELPAIGWKRRKAPEISATRWQHDKAPAGRANFEKLS